MLCGRRCCLRKVIVRKSRNFGSGQDKNFVSHEKNMEKGKKGCYNNKVDIYFAKPEKI